MKMMDILLEGKWDSIKSKMKQYFIDCSKKYFADEYKYKVGQFTQRGFKFAMPVDQTFPDLSQYSIK